MLVTKDTIIGTVIDFDPNAAKIFHMNGMFCTGCPHARSESIADACVAHGMDCDALVKALNEYFESKK
jgi:hybrid cluster-associated redox disulfide protein